jgi:hypothetical protein
VTADARDARQSLHAPNQDRDIVQAATDRRHATATGIIVPDGPAGPMSANGQRKHRARRTINRPPQQPSAASASTAAGIASGCNSRSAARARRRTVNTDARHPEWVDKYGTSGSGKKLRPPKNGTE